MLGYEGQIDPIVLSPDIGEAAFRLVAASGDSPAAYPCSLAGSEIPCPSLTASPGSIVSSGSTASSGPVLLLHPELAMLRGSMAGGRDSRLLMVRFQLEAASYDLGPLGRWSWLGVFLLFSALGAIISGMLLKVRI